MAERRRGARPPRYGRAEPEGYRDGVPEFEYQDLLPIGPDDTPYRLLTTDGVSTFDTPEGRFVKVEPEALTLLTREAMRDIAHLLRPGHLRQLRSILDDPEASPNDRFVALDLLKNAAIAAGGVLPMCQDTGTAIVKGKRGQRVITGGGDEEAIARGIFETYQTSHLRYSQMAPLTMWEEVNTGTNLPAEIKIAAVDGDAYKLLFMAKGGGSANKSYLYQETKAVLNEASMLQFLDAKVRTLGTAACPPYHLAGQLVALDLRQVLRRVGLQLLEIDAVGGDLAQRLAVGRAGHRDGDGAAGAVAGEADDPHVVAEVLAAELRADLRPARQLEDLGLQLVVPEAPAELVAGLREGVQVAGRRQLGRLHCDLGRGPAHHDGQVVGRACGRAQRADLGVEKLEHAGLVQDGLGLLVEVALVGRAASLGHEQQLVGVAVDGGDLDLGRQVGAGVDLLPHRQRRHLRVAQVGGLVGLEDAAGDGLLVAAARDDALAPLALDDGRARVLAHGEDAARGDAGVLQQVERDEAVVG